jgi:capsular exopolysaccharide synthesis family protein
LSHAVLASFDEEPPVTGTAPAAAPAEPVQAEPATPSAPLMLPADSAPMRTLPIELRGKSPLLPFDGTNFGASEQYRLIRTRLLQHSRQPRFLLISSTGPRDGKSVTAVNIAGALALKTEAKVLLADLDLRRSILHTWLGLPGSPGLAEVLTGTASMNHALVKIEQLPNLYFLPAGAPQVNPGELLDSDRWRWISNHLRADFRYIVADVPPVASVADYELLQASCDGVVLVVRPDNTRREACYRTLKLIAKDKLIGVVMNDVSDWFFTRRTPYNSYYSVYERSASDLTRAAVG